MTLDEHRVVQAGTLAIGYGAEGHLPLSFQLSDGCDIDLDYLRIYLTTQAVDLSYLLQDSPLPDERQWESMTRKPATYSPRPVVSWSHITIPVFQSR